MRSYKRLIPILILCFCGAALLNTVSAQVVSNVRTMKVKSTLKPLDAKALKLNSKATVILQSWIDAKHMQLMKSGHFKPMKNMASTSPTGRNLPGGSQANNFISGTNCAKIECPDVFDDSGTCWECH